MKALRYTIIKEEAQYKQYCIALEELLEKNSDAVTVQDEIELLTLLIEKYDEEHNSFLDADPITLLKSLMDENGLKGKDLVNILQISKGLVSDILNYNKGLSKDIIRKLAEHFKVSQETFNRPYKLKSAYNTHLRNSSVMNTTKNLEVV